MSDMSAKALAIAGVVTALSGSALGQQPIGPARPPLAAVLNTPEYQWVVNHICVPVRMLAASGYTNRDFVEAYFSISRSRWEASLEAQRRADKDGSTKAVAPILHGVIDLHWPNRVERDSSGAITRFRDCEELGNLQGLLREESSFPKHSAEEKERVTSVVGQVIRKWADGRPFDEVAEILRSGPMKLSESRADMAVGQKAALSSLSSTGGAQESAEQMIKEFGPLIGTVRGAVRYLIEQGKGCLPSASLAINPADDKAFVNFAFTLEMAKGLGENPAHGIAARLNLVAAQGPFMASAIGTCEADRSPGDGTPNVIALFLERRNGLALKMRFPFELSTTGVVTYLSNKATIERTPSLVFKQPNS